MDSLPTPHDDADFTIDLPPAEHVPAAPQPDRGQLEMRAMKEAIARVEAEAKANCAAESRAAAEARARALAEERAAMDAA
ncbi:hypothetical protein E4O92_02560, partial [Massilia horti]